MATTLAIIAVCTLAWNSSTLACSDLDREKVAQAEKLNFDVWCRVMDTRLRMLDLLVDPASSSRALNFFEYANAVARIAGLSNGEVDFSQESPFRTHLNKNVQFLIVYGKALHIISAITTIVCIEQPDQCGRLRFVFNQNGKLDMDRLTRDNPAVKNIKGYASISI